MVALRHVIQHQDSSVARLVITREARGARKRRHLCLAGSYNLILKYQAPPDRAGPACQSELDRYRPRACDNHGRQGSGIFRSIQLCKRPRDGSIVRSCKSHRAEQPALGFRAGRYCFALCIAECWLDAYASGEDVERRRFAFEGMGRKDV